MNEDTRPIGEDDLEAYIDGRLTGGRAALAAAALAADPALQARVTADRAVRDALRDRLNPIAIQPIPARLRVAPMIARRRAARRRRLGAAAACLLILAAGMGAGWEARGLNDGHAVRPAAAVTAIEAHRVFVVETAHPVEVGGDQQAHLVQWLSRRVGHALKTPDLRAQGFALMGGRVIPEAGQAAAQFMYQDAAGHRLTLLVLASGSAETRFRFLQADGFSAFSWNDDGLSFALVAAIDRPALLALAQETYRQLAPQDNPVRVAR